MSVQKYRMKPIQPADETICIKDFASKFTYKITLRRYTNHDINRFLLWVIRFNGQFVFCMPFCVSHISHHEHILFLAGAGGGGDITGFFLAPSPTTVCVL